MRKLILLFSLTAIAYGQFPNHWKRSNGTLSPKNSGDSVAIGTTVLDPADGVTAPALNGVPLASWATCVDATVLTYTAANGWSCTAASNTPNVVTGAAALTTANRSVLVSGSGALTQGPAAPWVAASGSNAVFEGDSITLGSNNCGAQQCTAQGMDWPTLASAKSWFTGRATKVVTAIAGSKLADLVSRYAAAVAPYKPATTGKPAYLFVLIGANDLSTVTDAATYYGSLAAYWAQAKSDGFTVIAATILPQSAQINTATDEMRLRINSLIRVGSGWDYLLDFANVLLDPTNTTLFMDGLHPAQQGYALMASYANRAMSSGGGAIVDTSYRYPAMTTPGWLKFFGNSENNANNCSTTLSAGEYWYSTFTVAQGNTCVVGTAASGAGVVIRAQSCTIAGTIDASGASVGSSAGDAGGPGGGGGGGTGAGTAGTYPALGATTWSGGAAGGAGGGAGGVGTAINTQYQRYILSGPPMLGAAILFPRGGGAGGAGGSTGGAGGKGGMAVILACDVMSFTGTINANGADGAVSPGDNKGAGGGGGGGYVIMAGRTWTANTGTITVAGGAGGSCGASAGCGAGGNGTAGWSRKFTINGW